ncbi:hypothetical protein MJM28_28430, partial [Salmonella enterica subsp. enterica serovar Montevideo]|nr:hypothetical protein [Salmonella enterica subsp. enterica serovar Montevideo]
NLQRTWDEDGKKDDSLYINLSIPLANLLGGESRRSGFNTLSTGNRGVHVVKFIPQAEYDKRSVQLTDAAMALARFGYYRENSLS